MPAPTSPPFCTQRWGHGCGSWAWSSPYPPLSAHRRPRTVQRRFPGRLLPGPARSPLSPWVSDTGNRVPLSRVLHPPSRVPHPHPGIAPCPGCCNLPGVLQPPWVVAPFFKALHHFLQCCTLTAALHPAQHCTDCSVAPITALHPFPRHHTLLGCCTPFCSIAPTPALHLSHLVAPIMALHPPQDAAPLPAALHPLRCCTHLGIAPLPWCCTHCSVAYFLGCCTLPTALHPSFLQHCTLTGCCTPSHSIAPVAI